MLGKFLYLVIFVFNFYFQSYAQDSNETKKFDIYSYTKCVLTVQANKGQNKTKNTNEKDCEVSKINCLENPTELFNCEESSINYKLELLQKINDEKLAVFYLITQVQEKDKKFPIQEIKNLLKESSPNVKKTKTLEESFFDKLENVIFLSLFGLLFLLWLGIFFLVKSYKSDNIKFFEQKLAQLQEENSNFQKRIVKREEITDLENTIQNLSEKLENIQANLNKQKEEKTFFYEEKVTQEKILYATTPHARTFEKLSEKQEESTYCYKLEIQGNHAEFSLVNELHPRILRNPDDYVKPACDVIGGEKDTIKGIETLEKGEARFENNKWVISKKAKVRYV